MRVKGVINSIWNEFVYGGHLLSLGASAILYSTILIFNKPVNIPLLVLGYGISQVIYTYNHFKEAEKDVLTNPERAKHVKQKKTKILFIFYLFLVIASTACLKSIAVALFVLFLVAGGLLFTDVFKGLTKKIIGFKTFYTSLFWAFLIILLSLYYNIGDFILISLMFLFVFLRWIINTAFFDIKDINTDKVYNLKTLPVALGRGSIIKYLHLLNLFSFAPLFLGVFLKVIPFYALSLSVLFFYSLFYLKKAVNSDVNIRKISYIMVDGEYLLWPIILTLSMF